MSVALLDAPRCLNVDAFYVGPPRTFASVPASALREAMGTVFRAEGTAIYRLRAAQECLDTLGVLRAYREPLEGETWQMPLKSERRLLAQVNAIIGLGQPALRRTTELAIDPDVPDPSRVFAALFALGCTEGEPWVRNMRDIFVMAVSRDPGEAAAAVEALSLCPNSAVIGQIEPLLTHGTPRVRASAVRVLAFRGALREVDWCEAVSDSDSAVRMSALSARCRDYDGDVCTHHLEPLLVADDELLVAAALRAGLGARVEAARDRAAAIARRDPSWANAFQCLAMFGRLRDARHIEAALVNGAPSVSVRAAATLGAISLVWPLLDCLSASESAPDADVELRGALAAITGLPFSATQDRASAQQLWTRYAAAFEPRWRYRLGNVISPKLLLHLLREGTSRRSERQLLYLELMALTQSSVPRFSPYDFVSIQVEALARIEGWLTGTSQGATSA